jgi:DNA-binding transcriptional ArsR family regulator
VGAGKKTAVVMNGYLAATKALADPSRVRMLCALRGGELCVCQLIELVGLAPSTVSKHMAILGQAELVVSRKLGRWVYYRLPPRSAGGVAGRMTRATFEGLEGDKTITKDEQRLRAIRKADPELLCRKILRKT